MEKLLQSHEQVVRYVGGSNYDAKTGRVNGSAFDRKVDKDDDGLSFTRRYVLANEEESDRDKIREIFESRMQIGSTAQFAQLTVSDAIDCLSDFDESFEFVENPLEPEGEGIANPAHALLLGLPFAGEAIGSLKSEVAGDLLARCVSLVFKAKKA